MRPPLTHDNPICPLWHLRFTLEPEDFIRLPRMNKGITLRGAFGTALRKLVCAERRASCDSCRIHEACPYGVVFSPRVPEEAKRLRLNRDIPRPFVIKPPLDGKETYEPGEPVCFDLVLVGNCRNLFPYVIVSFNELGKKGIGAGRGRFRIGQVECLDGSGGVQPVMEAGDNLVHTPQREIHLGQAPDLKEGRVRVRFLTPVLLKEGGKWVRPTFGALIKRVRDRINALSYFYGEKPLEMDFKSFGERAEAVRTVSQDLRWAEERRYSKHRDLTHKLKGYVGETIYEGELEEFWPLLWLGQYLHVGKAAAFGQGWYEVGPPVMTEERSSI
ncbi:MAG: CRISPR system precrRNA processing endoribonuclease RAMP protein Cas6 [Deltaproteobacteria bacterium]|nr:CRISPR system precrRNA processing endoribonuclease RAMP protein Cas6 [Deltaproteobacteria bacterium]